MTPVAATWSGESGKYSVPAVARPLDSLLWPDAAEKIAEQLARVPADKPLVIVIYGHDGNLAINPTDQLAKAAEKVWRKVLAPRKPDHVAGDIENANVPDREAMAATLAPVLKAAPGTKWSNFARKQAPDAANAPVLYGWNPRGETDQLKRLAANLDLANAGDFVWLGDADVADPAFAPYLPALYTHTIAKCGPGLVGLFDAAKDKAVAQAARDQWDAAVDRYQAATGGRKWAGVLSVTLDDKGRTLTTTFRLADGSTTTVTTHDLDGRPVTAAKQLAKR